MARIRFGAFIAPFHTQRDQNPNVALHRDVEVAQHLDRLGYDEVWFGEHHSGGAETITSPEIFCSWVAANTSRIKVGAGVVSLPYHNPLWVADRAVLLDHLTRGRFMLGLGPGVLALDAGMVGLEPAELRAHLEEDLPIVLQLLRSDGPVTAKSGRYELVDARLQLGPYSDIEVVLTSMHSPAGPVLAGRHGLGILQLSGLAHDALELLPAHLRSMGQAAAEHAQPFDRESVRVVGMMHLAETKDQAIADVGYGLDGYFDYAQGVIGGPDAGATFDERLEWALGSGFALVGTADEAIAQLEHLVEVSGGIGAFLLWAHEWASPEASLRSFEIFARRVIPALQGTARKVEASRAWSVERRLEREAAKAAPSPARRPAVQ